LKALTAISIAVGVLASSLAQAGSTSTQLYLDKDARTVDLGLAPQAEVRLVTLSLAVKNQAGLEAYAASTVDPASPNYRKFLTPAQVGAQFGQDPVSIAQVVNFLQAQGLKVARIYPDNMFITVQATNAQLAAAFGSPIHSYRALGQTWEAPAGAAGVPGQLAGLVKAVHGLNGRPMMVAHAMRQPNTIAQALGTRALPHALLPTPGAPATNQPGYYTTADLANKYDITPLTAAGLTGAGRTMGIVTLAGYDRADVTAYWDALGLAYDPNRITDVQVDGGVMPGDGPGSGGSGETSIDIEQAGGVAPGANIRVYLGPNNGTGFIDAFATAVNEGKVDTLSVSWGAPEAFYDPDTLASFHAIFAQAAAQGIPVIAASGDAGAYDVNRSYPYPGCTTLLSVDHPASDPMVLAAGGTTLPVTLYAGNTTIAAITAERPWAWDYLRDFIVKNYGSSEYYNFYFPVGDGGGVSVAFDRPDYQGNLAGVANSAGAQSLLCQLSVFGLPIAGYIQLGGLPAGVAGRNLPDVSLNADPDSGYLVYWAGGWSAGWGGTSFVAPQLNGILALIASGKQGPLGYIHPQFYAAFKAQGYGANSPFRAVSGGSNLFYQGAARYNPAAGLGSLDVANLARALGAQF
jgi:subtilase family serine protease